MVTHGMTVDIPPVDLTPWSPDDFTDQELMLDGWRGRGLPYYLTHFHRLAHAVVNGHLKIPLYGQETSPLVFSRH